MSETEERQVRGARTQSLFRDVNERVAEINHAFSDFLPLGDWVCECADPQCTERVEVTLDEYEKARTNPRQFVVAPADAHVVEEIEHVIDRTDRYWVVEKSGLAGDLTARIDPRRADLAATA